MRYLILLIFISCNSEMERKETAHPINVEIVDSMSVAFDSLKDDLKSFYQVSDYAQAAQLRIKQLEKDKNKVE